MRQHGGYFSQGTLKAMVLMASDRLIMTWRSPASSVACTRNSSRVSPTCMYTVSSKNTHWTLGHCYSLRVQEDSVLKLRHAATALQVLSEAEKPEGIVPWPVW